MDSFQNLARTIFERIDVGIFVVDREMKVVLWNGFMARYSGIATEDALGRSLFELSPELPERWLRKKIESVFLLRNFAFTKAEQRPWLFRFRHNRPVTAAIDCMRQDCTFVPIKGEDDAVNHVCVTVYDVTDASLYRGMMQDALARLEEMSVRDVLTGLYNRRHLVATLEAEFTRARRHAKALSVIMFDADHFKKVNDRHGHLAGDEVLRAIADRTRDLLRRSYIAGRYGGEEFTLVLPETDGAGAALAAERLRRSVAERPVEVGGTDITVTVSVGVSSLAAETEDHEALLEAADRALFEAKRAGRNRVNLCPQARVETGAHRD